MLDRAEPGPIVMIGALTAFGALVSLLACRRGARTLSVLWEAERAREVEARRGRPEAVEQMIEVQRIARESQREVRAVVRGCREADLGAELVGAQDVLSAAGIRSEVRGQTGGPTARCGSALGWVVRKATTNVLRHGDAARCDIALDVDDRRVVLTVQNDGAADPAARGGSGPAGLRERLSAVGATLEAGHVGGDASWVTAEVPLSVREITA